MLKMVDGTGIIGVDMICPLGVSTPQPPNYDRVELEGAGMLVLPNSLDAPLERLELGGKTEQVQTTGKNLANPSEFVVGTLAGDTGNIIKLKQYITTEYIPVIPGKRYSTSCGNKFSAHTIIAYDKEKTKINSPINMSSEMPEGAAYIRLAYKKIDMTNVTESDMEELKKVCMVNEGSTVLPYEPYTGGKPSPSPEYQQEIKSVGRLNEDTGKYEVDVKITGKNLFDIEKAKASGGNLCTAKRENNIVKITAIETVTSKRAYAIVSGGGICLKAGKTYFLNGRKVGTSNMTPMFAFFKEKNIGELLKIGNFYTPNEDIYIDIGIYLVGNAIGTGDTLEITDIIVCEGKDAAQYQPYTEQTLTLTSDRPITKWDKLVEQGGQIGWLYKSKVYDGFDGKNNRIELGNKVGNVRHFSVYFASAPNSVGNANSYCDKYIGVNASWTKEKFGIFCDWNNGVKFFSAPNEKVTNLEEFKAWLIENPLGLAYETLETEFVPLPQSEQNAIRALKTYYPTTVITADGGELDPDIKVTYRKEI